MDRASLSRCDFLIHEMGLRMIILTGREIRALLSSCSIEKSLGHLQHIHVGGGYVEATNGYSLLRIRRSTEYIREGLLPVESMRIVKLVDSVHIEGDTWVHFDRYGVVVDSDQLLACDYPNLERVLLDHAQSSKPTPSTFGLRSPVLETMAAWGKYLNATLEITPGDVYKGLRVQLRNDAEGLVMPARILTKRGRDA